MALPIATDQQAAYAIRQEMQQAHVMYAEQGFHSDLTLRTK